LHKRLFQDLRQLRKISIAPLVYGKNGIRFAGFVVPTIFEAELDHRSRRCRPRRSRATVEQTVLSTCKVWLERLSANAHLEVVEPDLDGHNLDDIRARITAVEAEVTAIRSAPTPPSRECYGSRCAPKRNARVEFAIARNGLTVRSSQIQIAEPARPVLLRELIRDTSGEASRVGRSAAVPDGSPCGGLPATVVGQRSRVTVHRAIDGLID